MDIVPLGEDNTFVDVHTTCFYHADLYYSVPVDFAA